MESNIDSQSNTPEGKVTAADIVAENFKGLPHLIKNANLSLFYCDLIVICMKDYAALQSAKKDKKIADLCDSLKIEIECSKNSEKVIVYYEEQNKVLVSALEDAIERMDRARNILYKDEHSNWGILDSSKQVAALRKIQNQ